MKIVSACNALLAKHQPSVRDVAKVTGLLVCTPGGELSRDALPFLRVMQDFVW